MAQRRYARLVRVCETCVSSENLYGMLVTAKGGYSWEAARDEDNGTFLMWLVRHARFNNSVLVPILRDCDSVNCGVNFLAKDNEGDTILCHAVDGQNIEAAGLILERLPLAERQALLDVVDTQGGCALAMAVLQGNLALVRLLLGHGARVLPLNNSLTDSTVKVVQVLHEAADWAPNLDIFATLVHDLHNNVKYTRGDVAYILNEGATYCDVHKHDHTLKDYVAPPHQHAPAMSAMVVAVARAWDVPFKL